MLTSKGKGEKRGKLKVRVEVWGEGVVNKRQQKIPVRIEGYQFEPGRVVRSTLCVGLRNRGMGNAEHHEISVYGHK